MKIGIIKEGKVPIDRRVPITPAQAAEITSKYPEIEIVCQSSDIRCYSNSEYKNAGIDVVDSVSDCDIFMGVKEVPIKDLIENKTYFFFSHTIKEQPYNRELLRAVLKKNIRLVDYEVLTNEDGQRVVAFGRYAGLVGAYNALYTYGQRYNAYHLKRAYQCFDLDELWEELRKVKLPPVKIVLTGGGRVAKGAMEILNAIPVRKVTPHKFLRQDFDTAVYVQLNNRDYYTSKEGEAFVRQEFYEHPEKFDGNFLPYAEEADILIAGAYWDPRAAVLFEREDMLTRAFRLRIIADITCDIEGSIPSTKKASTIDDPVYDYDPTGDQINPPYSDEGNITVMAVDNLPCELPRNASEDFGIQIMNHVIPSLIAKGNGRIVKQATIAENGRLTKQFSYLQGYVSKK
jgi:alanine dehydrogenase